jgi:aspartate ammonia-lyase
MNANEVIANRALELLGHAPGSYDVISPNSHVDRALNPEAMTHQRESRHPPDT